MDGINELAQNGLLGLLLSLSIAANIFFYREVKGLSEKRVEEALKSRDMIIEPLKSMQSTINLILESISKR